MVADGQVAVTAGFRGFGHLLDGAAPVAGGRVHVQIGLDVIQNHERGQFALALELTAIFAQLGRDQLEPELLVDAFLVAPGDHLVAIEEAVLVKLPAFLDRQFAEPDVVLF